MPSFLEHQACKSGKLKQEMSHLYLKEIIKCKFLTNDGVYKLFLVFFNLILLLKLTITDKHRLGGKTLKKKKQNRLKTVEIKQLTVTVKKKKKTQFPFKTKTCISAS